jgi:hypothetical protein
VAASLGIAPSRLEGREPASETTYVYDRRGRLLRSITRRESSFTEQDRAELIALALYREQLCPLHGGPLSECQVKEGEPMPSFVASSSYCHAQVEKIEAMNAGADVGKYHSAKLWMVRRR